MAAAPPERIFTPKYARKKEEEKARSKSNRVQFKSLIEQLAKAVSNGKKLNKNSTLEIAVAVTKLNTFYKQETKRTLTHTKEVSINNFLKITNSIGIGILETGMIVYATDQLVDYFKDVKYLIGYPLSKICYNAPEVIEKVFTQDKTDVLLQMKGNYKSKSSYDICLTGRCMYNTDHEVLFLGYSRIKPFQMLKNPSLSVSGCYMVTNSATLQVLKGHEYMDYLLNTKMKGTESGMYPHPDDMARAPETFGKLASQGFNELVFRLQRLEPDGTQKYIHAVLKMSLFKDAHGETQIASLVWPYGISTDGNEFTGDDFQMLANNPSLSNDLKQKTKSYRKAVLNKEGVFGLGYKTEKKPAAKVEKTEPDVIVPHRPKEKVLHSIQPPPVEVVQNKVEMLKSKIEARTIETQTIEHVSNSPNDADRFAPICGSPKDMVYPTPCETISTECLPDDIVEFVLSKGADLMPMVSPSYIMNDPYPVVVKVEPDEDSQTSGSSACFFNDFLNNNFDKNNPSLAASLSDLPDLLPTIDPKMETYDIMESMHEGGFDNRFEAWPIATTSNHALAPPNLTSLCSQKDTDPVTSCSSDPMSIPPPDEIFELLDELWVGEDLF